MDSVEFRNLGEICDISKGIQFNKKYMKSSGTYPVINGGINPSGYIEQFNQSEDTITISQGGASAGYVNWIGTKFWAGAHCYILKPSDLVMNRYLFHFLKSQEKFFMESQYGAGIPALAKSTLESCKIPIPSIEVQNKIVQILDKFSDSNSELISLLYKEIDFRKKQYEYYRDKLLTFDEIDLGGGGQLFRSLKDVLEICNGYDYKKFDVGTVPVYGSGGIMTYIDTAIYDKPSVLIPRKGSLKNLFYVENPFWTVDTIFYTKINPQIAIPRFVYFCLQKEHLEDLNQAGGVPSLTKSVLNEIKIPIPPIELQKKIVEILDRFDRLCNDLTSGIPAEIQARQKQYEFYRDKVLTFE